MASRRAAQNADRPRKTRTKKAADPAVSAKRGRGRPAKRPSPDMVAQVERLAAVGLNEQEMALVLDMHRETFAKYKPVFFDTAIAKGRAVGKMSSGLVVMREMNRGNMTAVIWYEKTRCGYHEKTHTMHSDPDGHALSAGGTHVAVGIFLPPNGRDIAAPGQEIPASFQVVALPSNGREKPDGANG
jgi:hypothetical protein